GLVAPQDLAVLILGESGTGKELVARAVYQHSRRSAGPFLAINCAAIPENLLESELFGHEKGAFTGADRRRIGKFEQCSGGTLFLDEIGDMTPLTQAKVLRVLQDGRFERVGGNETIRTDVRVIAATNRDLEQMVAAGEFRADLYYRLSIVTITLPPLRERGEDLPLLIDHFLRRFSPELGKEVDRIAPDALEVLRRYTWPGNIRELQSVIREALIVSTGPTLLPDFLPLEVRGESSASATVPPRDDLRPLEEWRELGRFIERSLAAGAGDVYREALQRFDRLILNQAMSAAGGLQCKASELLALSRPTLRAKLRVVGSAAKGSGPNEFLS
ncbi:MAG: sigma-54 interaction domain-containing protein, partial [Aureliella sp.]